MITIKQSWNEVTIAEFFHINSIIKDDVLNDLEKKVAILAVLAGVNESELDSYPISEIHRLFRQSDFIYETPTAEIKDYYFVNGKRYKLCKEINKLTAAQFIDLSSYTKVQEDILGNLHLICSTLLLPAPFVIKPLNKVKRFINKIVSNVKSSKLKQVMAFVGFKEYHSEIVNLPVETYLETPQEETAENIFNSMNINDANSISVFFCLLFSVSLKITEAYLEQQVRNQLKLISPMLDNQPEKERVTQILTGMEKEIGTGSKKSGSGLQQ